MRDIPLSLRGIEIKRERRIKKIRILILCVVLFMVIIFMLSFFSSNKNITINNLVVTGTNTIDSDEIKDEINKYISGKYFYIFSKSNTFIYPRRFIEKKLLSSFPRIQLLKTKRTDLNTIQIDIIERKGFSLYCGQEIPIDINDIGEDCYFLDDNGLIFDKAPYFSGNVYFKYYLPFENSNNNPIGVLLLPTLEFHRLVKFINNLSDLSFLPIYVTLINDNYHLFLEYKSENTSPKIIFNKNDDFDEILDDLSISIKKKEFIEEIKSKYNNLLYIDLRFKNKVLYKFNE